MTGVPWCIVAAAVVVLSAAAGHAHTLATTIVSVAMTRPGVVDITIDAEADPLIAKLEILAGVAPSESATMTERRRRIESLEAILRAHIDMRAAGTPLAIELQDVAVDETAQAAIHLTAVLPPDALAFTWRSTFIFGAYQLAIGSSDADPAIDWLQGPQASKPIALEASRGRSESLRQRMAATRIGHGLAMGALVVYVIGRRRAGHRLTGG
jgi:hypothetical protein